MDQVMVVLTEEGQVPQIGQAAVFALIEVVTVGEEHVGTARKDAVAITTPDLAPLGGASARRWARPSYMVWPNLVVEGHDHFCRHRPGAGPRPLQINPARSSSPTSSDSGSATTS